MLVNKSFPFCSTPQPDVLIWPKERSGQYSVKSGYSLLHESPPSDPVQTEEVEARKLFWRRIWKLRIPEKIKHFMWKSCTNSLPTKTNLLKRTITQDPVCHLCAS